MPVGEPVLDAFAKHISSNVNMQIIVIITIVVIIMERGKSHNID